MPKYEFYDHETNEYLGVHVQEEPLELNLGDRFPLNGEERRVMNLEIDIVTSDKKFYIK